MKPVRLRPHHLLCVLTYSGRGYSRAFSRGFDQITALLKTGARIEVVVGPDDVCTGLSRSPMRRHCRSRDVTLRDKRALNELKRHRLIVHASPLAPRALQRLRRAFARDAIRSACAGCSWKALCDSNAREDFVGCRL